MAIAVNNTEPDQMMNHLWLHACAPCNQKSEIVPTGFDRQIDMKAAKARWEGC